MRQKLMQLWTILKLAGVVFLVVGIAMNWNLFIVLFGLLVIGGIGFAILFAPKIAKEQYEKEHKKVERDWDKNIDTIAKKLKE